MFYWILGPDHENKLIPYTVKEAKNLRIGR